MTGQVHSRTLATRKLALMAILTGVMVVLGMVNIPMPAGLSITFNMIPVAIAAPVWMSLVQRFFSRVLMGFLVGLIDRAIQNRVNTGVRGAITGFCSAFLNTLLFMSLLVLLFGNTPYMQEKMGGRAFLAYIVASVGINGLVEMIVATFLTAAVGTALYKAGFFRENKA